MSCHDICLRYKAEIDGVLRSKGIGAYQQGFKRCNTCETFLTDAGVSNNKCICCKNRIKSKTFKVIDPVYRVNFV